MIEACVVTGGAGFIGCSISSELVLRFGRVVALDNLHPQIHPTRSRPAALHRDVELRVADVADANAWDALLSDVQPTLVIHLAAETGTGQSLTEATRHATVNVTGTAIMLDALSRANIMPRRLLLASSRAVYGEGAWRSKDEGSTHYPGQRTRDQLASSIWDFPGLEPIASDAATTKPDPVSVYGATKLAQEHILSSWAAAFGVEFLALRLQNVFGRGQSLANPYTGIVPLFCRIAKRRESIPLYEDGAMLRDFILIDDVAAAIIQAVDIKHPPRRPLDIGTGQPLSIANLASRVAALYGAPEPHVSGAFRYGDVRHAACRIEETIARLGWRPKRDLDEGLQELSSWIESVLAGKD